MAESLQRYTAAAARGELASKDAPPPKRIGVGDGGGPDADGAKRPDVR